MNAGTFLRAGVQSATIMGFSDMSTQIFIEGKEIPGIIPAGDSPRGDINNIAVVDDFDSTRTLRWAVLGLVLHGPYTFAATSFLDRRFASSSKVVSWKTVAKKTAGAQFIFIPPYLVALFGLLGILEENPDIIGKIQTRFPEALVNGYIYWPIVNAINFKVVPNTLRVPYLALSSGIWNSYLSYANQLGNDKSL